MWAYVVVRSAHCIPSERAMHIEPGGVKMYANFDGMVWPKPCDALDEVQWRLRYHSEIDKGDRMVAASVMSAYNALVECTQKKRNYVVANIRREGKK
jgi:hypothetical protein